MKKKIICIFVITLLIATVLPTIAIDNPQNDIINENQNIEFDSAVADEIEVFIDSSNPDQITFDNDIYHIYEKLHWRLTVTVYWDPPQPDKLICIWVDTSTLPQGATFPECTCDYGQVSAILDWTPQQGQAGTYNIVFYAGDSCYEPVGSFTITVVVHPYEPDPQNTYEIYEGQSWHLLVTAYWVPSQEKLICLWVDGSSLPYGATFTPECHCDIGQVSSDLYWTPEIGQAGEYIINFYAGETCGEYIFPFSIEVIVHPAELPEPFFVTPFGGDMVYGNVKLWAGEESGMPITVARFYYSTNGQQWTLIGEDYDGSERTASGKDEPLSDWGDGWSAYWDVLDMNEGWYYLKVCMWTPSEEYWCTDIQVYVEPTPPIPVITEPTYEEVVKEDIIISVDTTTAIDIDYVWYEYTNASVYYEKGVPLKNQYDYLKGFGPNGEDYGKYGCGPTAAASCLWYWSLNGFPNITKDPTTGKKINQSELIKRLATLMKTDKNGTKDSNFVKGLRDYLNSVGCGCTNPNGLKVSVEENGYEDPPMDEKKGNELTFKRYKNELEAKKEDVLWGVVWNWNKTSKEWENGHWVTGNSVNNTELNDSDGDGLKEHLVDIMDPSGGKILKVKMNTDGTYVDPDINKWFCPDIMVTVSKKKPKKATFDQTWNPIATVTDPTGGWPATWDTTTVLDGYYFIRATMVDDDGNQGEDIVVVKVKNINHPPNKPSIDGPTSGKINTLHDYIFTASDPDIENIYYYIEWGDGQKEEWIGPYPSGIPVTVSHEWSSKGDYQIKAKVKDIDDVESDWTILAVSMPRNRAINTMPLFLRFLQQHPIMYQLLQRFLKL